MNYILFLRGINVGGNKKVPMAELKEHFLNAGFEHVETILNTGNIVFESNEQIDKVNKIVCELLGDEYEFEIPFLTIHSFQLEEFIGEDKIVKAIKELKSDQKMIFSFAENLSEIEKESLKSESGLELIHSNSTILCLKYSSQSTGTPYIMKVLDKILIKRATSRNLNTVKKIIKKIESK